MSNPYKKLGGQALIYGLGNVVPRLLNYAILTMYYTRRFPPVKYGIITELYAYVAILLVILTYGMETGLFKFSKTSENDNVVFSTVLTSVTFTSLIFALFITFFKGNISSWIGYQGNPEYIVYLGMTLSIDAITSIFFAQLRIKNKVKKFAFIKILNVVITVILVFLFLEIIPGITIISNSKIYLLYLKNIEVGYVFIANLISSLIVLIFLLSELKQYKFIFNRELLKKVLLYSIPLLISGLAGIFNEAIDRILLRYYSREGVNVLYEIGIYGANYRIAVIMTIFIQMFRYAAEPFFFNWSGVKDSKLIYANILKYFTIFLMIIFLTVGLGIDFFKFFIDNDYYEGLNIVPIVLFANVIVGMLFNVNMWYKLSGHTMYGVYITGFGAIITIVLNILFIPLYGYFACAWIHLLSNAIMLYLTYYFGQHIYKINYDIKTIGLYIGLGLLLYFIGYITRTKYVIMNLGIACVVVLFYILFCNRKEKLLSIFLNK